jgi:aspartyl-tRNA(Asn)/glutamyl-tRNA(Gln) amidotransferase subunit A
LDGKNLDRLPSATREVIEFGRATSVRASHDAAESRSKLYGKIDAIFDAHDAIITPVTPVRPMPVGRFYPRGNALADGAWALASCTTPFSLTQQPAASVPAGFTSDGLPMGMQIAARKHADELVLSICKAYEEATGFWKRRAPEAARAVRDS